MREREVTSTNLTKNGENYWGDRYDNGDGWGVVPP
jgi:hypothetical protein